MTNSPSDPAKPRTFWTAKEHQRPYGPNFNGGMAAFIADTLRPKSLLEFGCGLGLYCDFIKRRLGLADVYGIEPSPMGGVFDAPDGPVQIPIDVFADPHPSALDREFDLILSIEVAEHIARERHDFLFDFLMARAANWIVFSGARVGQGGRGHIAERPEEEWRAEWTSRGAAFDAGLTRALRAASNPGNINHRRNVMVFKV